MAVETTKAINLSDLAAEVGVPLDLSGPDGGTVAVRASDGYEIDEAVLAAAIEVHEAKPLPAERLAELKAKGWGALTAAEKAEVQGLMLELA